MSNVLSRACASFVLCGGLGLAACASPARPSAVPPAAAESSGLTAVSKGVTDDTLKNAGWSCMDIGGGFTVCAQPGQNLPPIPFVPGGPPTYMLSAFLNGQFDHHVKFLRPDLFHGQPCPGGEPMELHPVVGYYHCAIPVTGN